MTPREVMWRCIIVVLATVAMVVLIVTGATGHDQYGNANWIAKGRFTSPIDGSHCCGEQDCFEIPGHDVRELFGGYVIIKTNEFIPAREVQPSLDGNFWRCMKPDGSRRCFFAPPQAT